MFDLAETLGMTVGQLEQNMAERELDEWALRRKPLAPRRVERMLAMICMFLARNAGAKDYTVSDADVFSKASLDELYALPQTGEEMAEDFAASLGGVKVLMLKKHRKQQGAQ